MSGLEVENLTVRYGAIAAVRGVSFTCAAGEIVAIVGPNGAGKSSALLGIAGGIGEGAVAGTVTYEGVLLSGRPAEQIVAAGVALVPESRRIFANLSVRENLIVGHTARSDGRRFESVHDEMCQLFPVLADFTDRPAGLLSGGQQQMLAIARALMSGPRIVLLDEPSLGLAPMMVVQVFEIIERLRDSGLGVVLVEQHAEKAVALADRHFLLSNGRFATNDTWDSRGSLRHATSAADGTEGDGGHR